MSSMDDTTRQIVTRLREAASDADHVVTTRSGSNDLAILEEILRLADALMATAVAATRNAVDTDAAEKRDGFDIETWLRLRTRRTYGDSKMLVEVADVVRHLPRTEQAWREGIIGWGEVRLIVLEARGLDSALLARLDDLLCDDLERLATFEPGVVIGAVREAVARLRPDRHDKAERRAVDHRFVAVQQAFDGSGSLYGEFDPQGLDTVVRAIDRAADLLPSHTDPEQLHHASCPATDGR